MLKILIIGAILGAIIYFIFKKIFATVSPLEKQINQQGFRSLDVSSQTLNMVTKKTFQSVGIGLAILFVVLILGLKIKILFILLPIAIYLIGLGMVFSNQLYTIKNHKYWYNPTNHCLLYYSGKSTDDFVEINLHRPSVLIERIESVQKNKDVLFGYYRFSEGNQFVNLPLLFEEEKKNRDFFEFIQSNYTIERKKVFFPFA